MGVSLPRALGGFGVGLRLSVDVFGSEEDVGHMSRIPCVQEDGGRRRRCGITPRFDGIPLALPFLQVAY